MWVEREDQRLTATALRHHDPATHHLTLRREVLGANERFVVVVATFTGSFGLLAAFDLALRREVFGADERLVVVGTVKATAGSTGKYQGGQTYMGP